MPYSHRESRQPLAAKSRTEMAPRRHSYPLLSPRPASVRRVFPAPLRSGETVRRVGVERCQSRIEAEPRPAVGTEDRVRLAHIDVDVRVVLRWGLPDALEFPHSDADFWDAAVVPEL